MNRRIIAFTLVVASVLGASPRAILADAKLSLDVRDLDIYDAVRLLSTQAATNVVLDASVQHRPVTIRLRNVTFERALQTIAQANDLEIVTLDGVSYLGPSDVMNRRYPASSRTGMTTVFVLHNAPPEDVVKSLADALPKGTVIEGDRRTSSIVVSAAPAVVARARELVAALDAVSPQNREPMAMRFVKASQALKVLQGTLPIVAPDAAFASDQQNEIVIAGSPQFRAQARDILEQVDRPGQQVRYDVRVTDISPTQASNVGVLFGGVDANGNQLAGSGSTVTTFLSNRLMVNATLSALVANGDAKILAQPSISSLNNVPASLLVGQQYPIVYFDARTGTQQVQFVNVGVNLNVTPTIGADGAITTDLETDYSQVTGTISSFPIISTRKAQSTLRVRDGETIVIAGLFSDIDSKTVTKVPFLGDIPIFGELFKNRSRTHAKDEVVFLITPHLVRDGDPTNGATAPPLSHLNDPI